MGGRGAAGDPRRGVARRDCSERRGAVGRGGVRGGYVIPARESEAVERLTLPTPRIRRGGDGWGLRRRGGRIRQAIRELQRKVDT